MIRIRTLLAAAGLVAAGTLGAQQPKPKAKAPATPAPAAATDTTKKHMKKTVKHDSTATDTTHKKKPAAPAPTKKP